MCIDLPVFLDWGRCRFLCEFLAGVYYVRLATNGLTADTIAGHLVAVKLFRRQEHRLELFFRHPWIVDALKGVIRSNAEFETKSRILRPLAWSVLRASESLGH